MSGLKAIIISFRLNRRCQFTSHNDLRFNKPLSSPRNTSVCLDLINHKMFRKSQKSSASYETNRILRKNPSSLYITVFGAILSAVFEKKVKFLPFAQKHAPSFGQNNKAPPISESAFSNYALYYSAMPSFMVLPLISVLPPSVATESAAKPTR